MKDHEISGEYNTKRVLRKLVVNMQIGDLRADLNGGLL
jgi:hypothetical protein